MPCAVAPEPLLELPELLDEPLELLELLLLEPPELLELLELLPEPLLEPLLEFPELLLSLPQALSAHAASTISAGFFMIASPEKRRRLLVDPGRCSDFSLNPAATAHLRENCDSPFDFRRRRAA